MNRLKAAVLIVILLLGAGSVRAADLLQSSISENNAKLKDLKDRIETGRRRIAEVESEEEDIRRGYDQIVADIELSQQLLAQMEERERTLKEQSTLLEQELQTSVGDYHGRRETLARTLRAMYLRRDQGELEAILTAGSFSNLVARVRMERMMAKLQAGLVADTRAQARSILDSRKQLDAALAGIWQSREDMAQETGRLEMLMAEHQATLRDLKEEKEGLNGQLLELSLNEQKLGHILADLEDQRTVRKAQVEITAADPGTLAPLAGKLEWPVRGQLLRGFGRSLHPRYQTVTLNNGINIASQQGAPVAAVAGGQVEYCDELPGFGQCVILDHGAGYYSLYAHLDRAFVEAGAKVARGQVIAEVGRPSAGEDPQLYFEIRQGRTPLDPIDWLRPR